MNLWSRWCNFWFGPRDLFNVSVFRVCISLVMLVMYAIRHADLDIFYGIKGILPDGFNQEILPELYRSPLPLYFHGDTATHLAHTALLIGLVLLTLGIVGRWGTWIIWVLHIGFMQQNFALVYGADLFANFWILYLSFINHNKHLNVLNLFKKNKVPMSVPDATCDMVSSAFTRLVQLQLCAAYAYTGIEKLKGTQWWEGTAVWYTLGMSELVAWDFTFLRQIPFAIGILSMAPLLFEVYFPMAMLKKNLRAPWLVFGALFHLGTAIVMDLWFFCLVMVSAYFVFLNSQQLRQMVSFIRYRLPLAGKK